jgi:ADP-heptose:LPS heptosyltransferase
MIPNHFKHIVISRTDAIGDVILTLPMAKILKDLYPQAHISFIGKGYTMPVLKCCTFIDEVVLDTDFISGAWQPNVAPDVIIFVKPEKLIAKAAKARGIKLRIGTSHRLFHLIYANKLLRFTRKRSDLHEMELNLKLLSPFTNQILKKEALVNSYGLTSPPVSENVKGVLRKTEHKTAIILHPKSRGSAREWPLESYIELTKHFANTHPEVLFLITGTEAEGALIRSENRALLFQPNTIDLTGQLTLKEFISLIGAVDGLVACSTGPLHIASALGKNALGLYPPTKPMHPGRWAPVGPKASFLVQNKPCEVNSKGKKDQGCSCLKGISVSEVESVLDTWLK